MWAPSEYFLVIAVIAALCVAYVTSDMLTRKERFAVHVRALAVCGAILFGGFIGSLASDYAGTADKAWQIGIGLGASFYAVAVYRDRMNQRRIANGEEVSLGVLSRYAWMLPRDVNEKAGDAGKPSSSEILIVFAAAFALLLLLGG